MDDIEHDEAISAPYPVHPGLVLKLDVLPSREITAVALAKAIGTPRPSITNILNGKKPITPEMAARIEAATGYSASLLLRMQVNHDLAQVMREGHERLRRIPRLAA